MSFVKSSTSVALLAFAYLLLWPVDFEPEPWEPKPNEGYVGAFAANTKLDLASDFDRFSLGSFYGPEAITGDNNGNLYTGVENGDILKWTPGLPPEIMASTEGRPLGLAFDANNNLWIADSRKGLLKLDPSGRLSVELDNFEGEALGFADDLDISKSGKIYLSDATTRYPPRSNGGEKLASRKDILEHQLSGRLIEFDPNSGKARLVASGFNFLNGVATDESDQFVLANETGHYRVWKIWISEEKFGEKEIVVDNLPGFPDNIHRGLDGRFWLGLVSPRSQILDLSANLPWLRKVIYRLPNMFHPDSSRYGMVVAINSSGEILQSLQSPSGEIYETTGAWETRDHLFISRLSGNEIVRLHKENHLSPF